MSNYPHKCPECQSPAYVGFARVECSAPEAQCRHSDGKAHPFHGATFKDPFDLGVAAAVLWAKAQAAGFGQVTAGPPVQASPPFAPSPSSVACPDCGSSKYNSTPQYLFCRVCGMAWKP